MPRKYRRRSTLGTIEQRGSRYRIKWTDTSKQIQRESGFVTYQEADERLLEIQLGVVHPTPGISLDRYWRMNVEPTFGNLANKTSHEYVRQWNHDIKPYIGNMPLGDIDWRTIQRLMDELKKPGVQRSVFALLRKVFNMAIRDKLITTNPCDPTIRLTPKPKPSKKYLDAVGVLDMLDAVKGTKYEPIPLLILACGLRVEEVSALNWEDLEVIDIYGKKYVKASIEKVAVTVGSVMEEEERTKNDSSYRYAIIGDPFAERLIKIMQGKDGPLVKTKRGERTPPMQLSKYWKAWCEISDVEHITFLDMRSVYATLACEAADSSLVSMAMGHSDGTTRGRNYQSATLRGMAIVADLYGEYLKNEYQLSQTSPSLQVS